MVLATKTKLELSRTDFKIMALNILSLFILFLMTIKVFSSARWEDDFNLWFFLAMIVSGLVTTFVLDKFQFSSSSPIKVLQIIVFTVIFIIAVTSVLLFAILSLY